MRTGRSCGPFLLCKRAADNRRIAENFSRIRKMGKQSWQVLSFSLGQACGIAASAPFCLDIALFLSYVNVGWTFSSIRNR